MVFHFHVTLINFFTLLHPIVSYQAYDPIQAIASIMLNMHYAQNFDLLPIHCSSKILYMPILISIISLLS
jgi:hypothetical protein